MLTDLNVGNCQKFRFVSDDLPVNASASMAYVVGEFETIVTVLVRPGSVSWAG